MVRILTLVAGSPDVYEVVCTLLERAEELHLEELRLHEETPAGLRALADSIRARVESSEARLQLRATSNLVEALRGTDAVLYSGQPGGSPGRRIDERLPPEFGIPGNEAVGPGGFLAALRVVPHALAVATAAGEHAPDAIFLNRAEPVSIVTQALTDVGFEKVIGLCEQPIRDMEALGRALGLDGPPSFRCVGLHEATWYTDIELGDRRFTRPPDNLVVPDDLSEEGRAQFVVAHRLAREHEGAWPSSNLAVYAQPRFFLDLDKSEAERVALRPRPGALLADVLAALVDDAPRRLVLNLPNSVTTPQLGIDTVVQADFEVSSSGVTRIEAPPLPEGEESRFRQLELYQVKAAQAARRASEDAWVDALLANPLVDDPEVAKALVAMAKDLYGEAAPILGGDGPPEPGALA